MAWMDWLVVQQLLPWFVLEYIAFGKSNDEICKSIGADWLIYQKLEDLVSSCIQAGDSSIVNFDCSCFNGVYVTGGINEDYLRIVEKTRADSIKQNA